MGPAEQAAESGNRQADRAESGRYRERMATPGDQPVRGAERRQREHHRDEEQAAQARRGEVGPVMQIERCRQRSRGELDQP